MSNGNPDWSALASDNERLVEPGTPPPGPATDPGPAHQRRDRRRRLASAWARMGLRQEGRLGHGAKRQSGHR